ncbi:MAG: hypothetical protein JWP07_2721, partial [Pseudonocardiales bacterium]|nr:hypothetical protein [Pseudonocardiales bacterium]
LFLVLIWKQLRHIAHDDLRVVPGAAAGL